MEEYICLICLIKKNNNNLNFDSLLKIDNHNLNKLLNCVSDKPILLEENLKVNENLKILLKYDSAWFGKLDYDFGNIKSKTLDIQIDAYDINESLERAKKILKDFFENWSIIKTEIIEKIYEYYNEKRKQLGYDIELNEFYPNVNDKFEITNMIEIIGITIPSDVYECGIVCNCTWEEEHGLGIRLVNNKVVEIGEQGIAL